MSSALWAMMMAASLDAVDDVAVVVGFAFSMAFTLPMNVAGLDVGADVDVDDDVDDDDCFAFAFVAAADDAFAFACFPMAVSGGNGDDTHML